MRCIDLPNYGIVEYKLNETEINQLYSLVKKYSPDGYKWEANKIIEKSSTQQQWGVFDDENQFQQSVLSKVIHNYLVKYGLPFCVNTTHQHEFTFQRFWCNAFTEGHYQAAHDHDAAFSFVIWLNIPFHTDDERCVQGSMHPEAGDFMLIYNDICGKQRKKSFHLCPEMNGTMILFPSQLHHAVYPHFTTNEPRISVAGDIAVSSYAVGDPINPYMIQDQFADKVDAEELKRMSRINSQEYIVRDPKFKEMSKKDKNTLFFSL